MTAPQSGAATLPSVWVCRLAMMVLPIYTHDQGAGFESAGSDRRSRQHLIRRLILQFALLPISYVYPSNVFVWSRAGKWIARAPVNRQPRHLGGRQPVTRMLSC